MKTKEQEEIRPRNISLVRLLFIYISYQIPTIVGMKYYLPYLDPGLFWTVLITLEVIGIILSYYMLDDGASV